MIRCALLASAIALMVASGWAECLAQSDLQTAEYELKAALLYRFTGYVEWPPGAFERPDSPLVIGVAGADAFSNELAKLVEGRTVGGRQVTVRRVHRGNEIAGLHVLFIGRSDIRPADVLTSAKGKPVLTVTESEDAFTLGSMINFVIVDDKVRFDVALRRAELANLKISARLLSVARKVVAS